MAMSKICPTWFAEATDRLLAADGLIARDSDDDEEDEDERKRMRGKEEDSEDESDGYSE